MFVVVFNEMGMTLYKYCEDLLDGARIIITDNTLGSDQVGPDGKQDIKHYRNSQQQEHSLLGWLWLRLPRMFTKRKVKCDFERVKYL